MIDNSYYIILNRLKAFANGHYLINTFTYHEIANFDISKNPHYPIMHAVPLSMNPSKGAIDYSFEITFADWVRAKEEKQENEVTVISDLHRCALDLCAEITNGNILFGDEVTIQGDAIITPFIDEFANTLSGVTLQITIRIPYDWSACDIPANWVDGTGDIPDFGGRSLTMVIYDEGNFVVAAREMNFVGSGVTVTYTDNRAIVTINGGSGGGAVDSVNGQTGVVVLDASDVGADAAGSAASALASANSYTDSEIAALTAADVGLGNVDNTSDLDKPISTATQAALDLKVESVTGDSVDNTDPLNPVVNAIPLAGTVSGSPVTGSIEENIALAALFNDWMYQGNSSIGVDDEGNLYIKEGTEVDGYAMFRVSNGIGAESRYTNSAGETTNVIVREDSVATKSKYAGFVGQVYDADYSVNFTLRSLIDQEVMRSRIWTKAGTPTTTDDINEGYVVGSLIWDTTNDIFYKCTDNTATAAVWVKAIKQTLLDSIRPGGPVPTSSTRWATEGLTGYSAGIVVTIAARAVHTKFRVLMTSTQPATGSLTIERKFYDMSGTLTDTQTLVIPAGSTQGIYEYAGASVDCTAVDRSYGIKLINAATSSSGFVNSIESTYEI